MQYGQARLVDIVRDFVVVHQKLKRVFDRFREGSLHFDEVRALVSDDEASVLFRLKEEVHALFRNEALDSPLRRGEALFDLAIGSLFHEALKFRENLYQIEVYGPKIHLLRSRSGREADELLAEFEKILRAASDRLGESLRETETLLEQTRRQLLVLLSDPAEGRGPAFRPAGLVTRYLIEERKQVEEVYPEGLDLLLETIHADVPHAYLYAIRSHLDSANFGRAVELISESAQAGATPSAGLRETPPGRLPEPKECTELETLRAYSVGMQSFLSADYGTAIDHLARWLDECAPDDTRHDGFAVAALRRIPELVTGKDRASLIARAAELVERLERRAP